MTGYTNTNKGTLGRNKKKQSEKSPEYSGKCNIDGKEYWISAWVKENSQTKEKFFSLSFKAKELPEPTGYNDSGPH